jgi:hypothetical protein
MGMQKSIIPRDFLGIFVIYRGGKGTEIGEGVHSLGWAGREEERWWKIGIVVGEYQWVVGFLSRE